MRAAVFALALFLVWPAELVCQATEGRPPGSGSRTLTTNAPISGRPPTVYWKHDMPGKPSPLPEPPVTTPRGPAPAPAQPAQGPSTEDTNADDSPAAAATPEESVAPATPVRPSIPAVQAATPAPKLSREQMLQGLSELHAGASRAEMIRRLGPPVYSIGMPDGGRYLERCRFRAGDYNIATVELRDGIVDTIDKAVP